MTPIAGLSNPIELSYSETIRRVCEQLHHIGLRRSGQFGSETVASYHLQLDRLQAFGKPIDEFRIQPDDWISSRMTQSVLGGVSTYNNGPLRWDEPLVISRSTFAKRLGPALNYIDRLIHQDEEDKMVQANSERAAITNERNQILVHVSGSEPLVSGMVNWFR